MFQKITIMWSKSILLEVAEIHNVERFDLIHHDTYFHSQSSQKCRRIILTDRLDQTEMPLLVRILFLNYVRVCNILIISIVSTYQAITVKR